MAKIIYGKTWWGQKWLETVSNLDLSNQLPRGKTYANKGNVQEINIEDGKIYARVKGSSATAYREKLYLEKPITASEKDFIIEKLIKDDSLLIKLLAGLLPKELFDICEKEGIRLFPSHWVDLGMSCTCSERNKLPCKHIAAIIYVLANEIDRNPFLIFEINGVDLPQELEQRGISIKQQTSDIIPKLDELSANDVPETEPEAEHLKHLDFSKITDLSESLFGLISGSPLFCVKDFKEVLRKAYKNAALAAKKSTTPLYDDFIQYHRRLKNAEEVSLVFESDMSLMSLLCYTGKEYSTFSGHKVFEIDKLVATIRSIKEEELIHYPYGVKLLYYLYLFSTKLVVEQAYIPQIVETAQKEHTIRWIPAHISNEVEGVCRAFEELIPDEFLYYNHSQEGRRFMPFREVVNMVCHLFIQHYVFEGSQNIILPETDQFVFDCFFGDYPVSFNRLGKKAVPNTIQRWLGKFFLTHRRYTPLLSLSEEYGIYYLRVFVEDKKAKDKDALSLEEFLSNPVYASYKYDVLRDLHLLTEYLPKIQWIIDDQGEGSLSYDAFEVVSVLLHILPVIEMLGIRVMMPKALRNLVNPKLSLSIHQSANTDVKESYLHLQEMLDFDWQVAIGDKAISAEEFKDAVIDVSGLIKIKDQFVLIDPEEVKKLLAQLENPPKIKPNEILQAALSEEYAGSSVSISDEMRKVINDFKTVKEVKTPKGLKASLRPYQQRGFEWMYKNATLGFGCLIADDMGLGKTLQVITTLLKFKEEKHFQKKQGLVIVPTSLLTNWQKEIQKFAPSLKVSVYHGALRKMPTKTTDVILTTYGVARTDLEKLKKLKLYTLVIDEAQNIKNVTAAQTKAIKSLRADLKIAMSGTPVENRLSEYWSIIDFTNKGYLGTLTSFTNHFAKPIQKDRDQHRLGQFMQITEPFILRRLKSDRSIIKDLPDKVENNQYCSLTKEQTAVYQSVVSNIMGQIKGEDNQSTARKGLILKLMMSLKQVCNHPYQYLKKGDVKPEVSGKAKRVFELLDEIILENNEKTLIFTQYKEMGNLLSDWIEERYGRRPLFLHGGTSRKQRDEMVDDFQNNHATNVFILSLKAGGTGLNLTAASSVIHYDLWWNPAVEAQATDRAYRIGQKNNVMVHRLITQHTFEEKINDMLHNKKDLADMTVNTGETWIGDLSNEDLQDIVNLEV